ncbi:heat-inducible transcription repressor HrcA [Ruaniaceae bacterium KH17]|nr:heat-inducible transcription repressor HrcA [Ruaniaceae bacterium KH17]
MSDDRRMDVLRAIVRDYVDTREPVGSRAIVERHGLDVSPATVRNDMAYLEEMGYITQPHTSAGRIPTDVGYRRFVDQIAHLKPLSQAERRAIETFLEEAVDLNDVMERTARLLSQITHQVAIIQYPSLERSVLRHIELVPIGERRLLVVVIMESGRVEQRTIEADIDPDDLSELRSALNAHLAGKRLSEFPDQLAHVLDDVRPQATRLAQAVAQHLAHALELDAEDRIVLAGTGNLARATIDFPHTIEPVLDALEEQVVMLRLITEMTKDEDLVAVSIGAENRHDGLREASLVSTAYAADSAAGSLAVIGPTRMDYPGTMAAVRAVSRYVSHLLNGN